MIKYSTKKLAGLSDSAKLDCQILLAHVIDKPTSYLYTWPEKSLSDEQKQAFILLLNRRIQGEPIAYIVGCREFWSLNLFVSPATLIPRPDTEVLVEQVLENHQSKALSCLDMGTGTGAIALALASENQAWQIDAIDFNEEAVRLAQLNAKQLALDHVNIFQSNWFGSIPFEKKYHVIVSNPPYINPEDIHLELGDVRFEPKSALVANEQGLSDIIKIIFQAKKHLHVNGYLYLEHGYDQGAAIRALFSEHGYQCIQTVKDYNDNERVTFACYVN